MDNSTRRQLLDRARSAGFPGSILDVYAAYDQGRDLVQEHIQQQQMASTQPPMQVAQTPQEQEQGLRPAHEAGNVNQSMAFPNVQPGQSFNTVGMKVPINIDKVDNQGNLVESYKAVPPGIQNLPTGPYEGTVIESPAKMQKGGFHQKIYTDPEKFAVANKAYNDSLTFYNKSAKRFPKDLYKYEKLKWFPIENEEIDLGTDSSGRQIVTTVQRPDPVSKQKILPTHYYSKKAQYRGSSVKTNKVTDKGGDVYEGDQLYEVYKKPTQEPVYQTRPEVKNLPYKDVTDALKNKDAGIIREYTTKELNPKYKKVYDKSPYNVKEYGPEGKFTHWAKEDEKIPGVWRPIKDTPSDLYVTKKQKFQKGGFYPSSTEDDTYESQYSQPEVTITPDWTEEELERNRLRDKYIADDKKAFRHWYDKLGYDKNNVTKRANQYAYNKLAKEYLKGDRDKLTPEQRKFIGKSEYADRLQPSIFTRFDEGWKQVLDARMPNSGINLKALSNLAAPFEYPANLVRGAVKGEFLDAVKGQTTSPYFVSSDLAGTSPNEAAIASGVMTAGTDPLFLTGDEVLRGAGQSAKKIGEPLKIVYRDVPKPNANFNLEELRRAYHNSTRYLSREESNFLDTHGHGIQSQYRSNPTGWEYLDYGNSAIDLRRPINGHAPGTPEWNRLTQIIESGRAGSATPKKPINKSGLTKEQILERASDKDKDAISKMSETEFENTVLKPTGEIVEYDRRSLMDEFSGSQSVMAMSPTDYAEQFNSNIDLLNDIISKKNKSGVQYRVKELTPDGLLTFETPEQSIPKTLTPKQKENIEWFTKDAEDWAVNKGGLVKEEKGWVYTNPNVQHDEFFKTKDEAIQYIRDEIDRIQTPKTIKGYSSWTVGINPGQWRGDVKDIASTEYFRSIPGLEMQVTSSGVFPQSSGLIGTPGTKAYESINEYLKKLDLGRVKPGFNSQTETIKDASGKIIQTGSKDVWENFINSGRAVGFYGKPKTVYGTMKTILPPALVVGAAAAQEKKQMGGSYETNQEVASYEWRTGRPEESRKRYIKGGLKNRVLYNKAKYKR